MSTVDTLSGSLRVQPGRARPHNVSSTRRGWADLLLRGRPPAQAAAILGNVYALCGGAHRLCAELAVDAAGGRPWDGSGAAAQTLQRETLREHLHRISLDWPEQLAASPSRAAARTQARAAAACCPLIRDPAAEIERTAEWLHAHLLGTSPTAWLRHWQRDRDECLAWWTQTARGWLPEAIDTLGDTVRRTVPALPGLQAHADRQGLVDLADDLWRIDNFERHPTWRDACAETGTWTRSNDDVGPHAVSLWHRVGARIAEVCRLALPDAHRHAGSRWLRMGGAHVAPGRGIGWVEMARGLLVHCVQLEHSATGAVIERYRIVAPTEWNFHPDGAVARALEHRSTEREIAVLLAAYDPCVRVEVVHPHVAEGAYA